MTILDQKEAIKKLMRLSSTSERKYKSTGGRPREEGGSIIRFREGLNIIVGGNRTGKTSIIKAIEKISQGKKFEAISQPCFLIDNTLCLLNEETRNRILKELAQSKNQTIITLPDNVKIPKVKANIINTKNLSLSNTLGKT